MKKTLQTAVRTAPSSDQEEGAEDYDENSYSDYSDESDYE